MSLLEVLISVFVLSMGLLGILAVIPLAGSEIREAAKADRSAAAGDALLHQVKVMGVLDKGEWADPFCASPDIAGGKRWYSSISYTNQKPYAIDPLYLSQLDNPALYSTPTDEPLRTRVRHFPYQPNNYNANDYARYIPDATLNRATLNSEYVQMFGIDADGEAATPTIATNLYDNNMRRQRAVWGRYFGWHDDLQLPVPGDPQDRPRMMFLGRDQNDAAWTLAGPYRTYDTETPVVGWNALTPQSQGNYSYLVTVTEESEKTVSVSVVMFYQRDFSRLDNLADPNRPGERTVIATLLGGGAGGGDALLVASDLAYIDHLEVKEGEWLMLAGTVMDDYASPNVERFVFRWYRIASVGEIIPAAVGTKPGRYVTLEGPDWDMGKPQVLPGGTTVQTGWCLRYDSAGSLGSALTDLNGDGTSADVQACLFDGIVGVFTTTLELE